MKHFCKLALPIFTAFGVFLYVVTTTPVHAVQGTIYFSPASATYAPGQTFTVEVRASVPANTSFCGGATINVTYPTGILQATAVSSSGGALGGSDPSISNGTVAYSRFMCPSQAVNNQKIFNITFRALTTGTPTLNFTTNTTINDGPTTRQPATFTIATPTCPAGQTGTPPNCITPAPAPTTPAPSTPANNTPSTSTPAISSAPKTTPTAAQTPQATSPPAPTVAVTPNPPSITDDIAAAAYDTAEITWHTQDAATTSIRYGTSVDALELTSDVTSDSEVHSATLKNLQLGNIYFYEIDAKNASDVSVTKTGSFTTKAYPVILRITQGTTPVADAHISLKGKDGSYTTTRKGEVALTLMPGNYTMQLKTGALTTSQLFVVKKIDFTAGTTPDAQIITVKLTTTPTSPTTDSQPAWPIIILVLTSLIVTAGVAVLLLWKRHRATQAAAGYESVLEHDYTTYTQPTAVAPLTDTSTQQIEQSFASPGTPETMTYQPPQSYAAPTYTSQSESYLDPAAIPMAPTEAIEEPLDMWSAPASVPQEIDQDSYTAAAAPPIVEPITPDPASVSQPPDISPQNTPGALYQDIVAPSTEQLTPDADTEDSYEYNEDNSMTIHHAR